MARTENVELTALCLIHRNNRYLLQERAKKDWPGYVFPGGHIEKGESIVDAVVREMKEETGLTIRNPRLRGVKQFPIEGGRYIVFLFETEEFEGEVVSSEEGTMCWIQKEELQNVPLADDMMDLFQIIFDDSLTEFQYIIEDDKWKTVLK